MISTTLTAGLVGGLLLARLARALPLEDARRPGYRAPRIPEPEPQYRWAWAIPELEARAREEQRRAGWWDFVVSLGDAAERLGTWSRPVMCAAYPELTQIGWAQATDLLVAWGVMVKRPGAGTWLLVDWQELRESAHWRRRDVPYPTGEAPPSLEIWVDERTNERTNE